MYILYLRMQMGKSDMNPYISNWKPDGILIILQLEELINETVYPQVCRVSNMQTDPEFQINRA